MCAIQRYKDACRNQFVGFAVKNDFMSTRALLKKKLNKGIETTWADKILHSRRVRAALYLLSVAYESGSQTLFREMFGNSYRRGEALY